ncbi:protein-disulfide reductase DsbD family protein [Bradyrhizobium sp. HKCCYLS1011]|uniref:protein-disulfide reductase DsbD family protein n=1 Tax=Bradyrhizobium sp. HKCCYLS1011 TaxID=3420733 RepID=UPI003EBBF77F
MFVRLTAVVALLAALALAPAAAQTAGFHPKADVSTRLLVGDADDAGSAAWLGLDVRLGPEWHTYWRSAGDAGAPPEFDWSGSQNVADVTVEWPAPRRFTEADIDTYGYENHVLFPLHVRLKDASAPAHLSLKAVLYVCSVICTQNEAQLEAEIAPGSHQNAAQTQIDEWRHKVPRNSSPTLSIQSLRLERQPKPHLVIEAHAQPELTAPDVFVDGDLAVAAGRPHVEPRAEGDALISIPVNGLDQTGLQRPLRVTLVDGERALEAALPQVAAAPSSSVSKTAAATSSIWVILGIALLGGFILNLMPCVFPVLSLKVVSLIDHRTTDAPPLRAALLATAAGILASFAALAVTLSTLKAAGAQIGWGLQFQQPAFLIAMSVVLVAFAANLLGLFEIGLPWWLGSRIGQAGHGRSLAGHVFNGFVMTLLATPCSAPFVGTAVAFALSQQAPQILLVFAGLGLGMASPYLALAAVPRLAALLPRPGRWMIAVRALAAAAMIATTLWLIIILAEISGIATAGVTGALLLAFVLALAASRIRLRHAIPAALATAAIALVVVAATRPPATETKGQEILWQPLVPAEIADQVRTGHTVFVDIGASWCVTCKVNETLVLDGAAVHRRLASDVIPVKADWTKPNDTIAAYLKSFDRYGLPFNVVFGPGAPNGIVLPELLTQEIVLDAIDTASRPVTAH